MAFCLALDILIMQYVYKNYNIDVPELVALCLLTGLVQFSGISCVFSALMVLVPYMLFKIIQSDYK